MLYGMNARLPNGPGPVAIAALWKLWDDFGISTARMVGYWSPLPAMRVLGPEELRATAYVHDGKAALVCVASWAAGNATVSLLPSAAVLGFEPQSLCAPAVAGYQDAAGPFASNRSFNIRPAKGLWLIARPAGRGGGKC